MSYFPWMVSDDIYVTLKDRKCSLSGKTDNNALWY